MSIVASFLTHFLCTHNSDTSVPSSNYTQSHESYHLWSSIVLLVVACLFPQHSQPCCAASESHTAPAASDTVCSSPLASQTPHYTFFCNLPSSGTHISNKSLWSYKCSLLIEPKSKHMTWCIKKRATKLFYFLQGCDFPPHGGELKFPALILLGQHLLHLLKLGFGPWQIVLLIHTLLMGLFVKRSWKKHTKNSKKHFKVRGL